MKPAPGTRPTVTDGAFVRAIEWILLLSRWLMVPLLLSLLTFPIFIAGRLWLDVARIARDWTVVDRVDLILTALHSVDLVLIAGLVLMVALSAYDELVSRLDVGVELPSWLGKIDSAGLKLKVILSILAIATIELLGAAFAIDTVSDRTLTWSVAIYAMFMLGTLVMMAAFRLVSGPH